MSNPFFLTRQSANLMEDFVRELNQGSALFLLYGDTGVGKTRLLQELAQSRLADRAVFWLDLDSEDGSVETRMDRSAEVEALFAAAGNGDIIIADHFEMALKKTRHQLFLSWSTDGIDKQLNLIIASGTEGFNELRQLSQQYGVRMQSFQQMPFNADEVQAFLGFYLFPDQAVGKLKIPAPLRKQIAATRGHVGQLIEIAKRDGAQIKSEPVVEKESIRQGSRLIVYVMVLVVLAAAAGWYVMHEPDSIGPPPITLNLPRGETPKTAPATVERIDSDQGSAVSGAQARTPGDEIQAESATGSSARAAAQEDVREIEAAVETEQAAAVETAAVASEIRAMQPAETAQQSDKASAQGLVEAEPAGLEADTAANETELSSPGSATTEPEMSSPEPAANEAEVSSAEAADGARTAAPAEIEAGVVPESEAVMQAPEPVNVDQDEPEDSRASAEMSAAQRFEAELRQSMNWIGARDNSVGTIQILLLSYENFDPENFYDYVNRLAAREVDVDQLHVFRTLTGKREVYSVVYGEYASRKSALGAIDELPAALRDTAPLARSVGGLWQEIQRLETKN